MSDSTEAGGGKPCRTRYACSSGDWGSYTKAAVVDAPSIPAFLDPYASTPGAVRAFMRAHSGIVLGGWSHVSR